MDENKTENTEATARKCPYCAEQIQFEAKKCKHCGEFLDPSLKPAPKTLNEQILAAEPAQSHGSGVAGVLSFFIPGLGQLYKGQPLNGIAWFCIVVLGYACLIVPGLILHFFCIIGALQKK